MVDCLAALTVSLMVDLWADWMAYSRAVEMVALTDSDSVAAMAVDSVVS